MKYECLLMRSEHIFIHQSNVFNQNQNQIYSILLNISINSFMTEAVMKALKRKIVLVTPRILTPSRKKNLFCCDWQINYASGSVFGVITSRMRKSVQYTPSHYKFQHCTKNEVSIKYFFSKCDQIRSFLWIWSHLLKKSLMKNFIFCAV